MRAWVSCSGVGQLLGIHTPWLAISGGEQRGPDFEGRANCWKTRRQWTESMKVQNVR